MRWVGSGGGGEITEASGGGASEELEDLKWKELMAHPEVFGAAQTNVRFGA